LIKEGLFDLVVTLAQSQLFSWKTDVTPFFPIRFQDQPMHQGLANAKHQGKRAFLFVSFPPNLFDAKPGQTRFLFF
jgi:hypothetical protein